SRHRREAVANQPPCSMQVPPFPGFRKVPSGKFKRFWASKSSLRPWGGLRERPKIPSKLGGHLPFVKNTILALFGGLSASLTNKLHQRCSTVVMFRPCQKL